MEKLNIKKDSAVLDIGCGDGSLTVEIASLVPEGHVKGVDNSVSMIKSAKKKYPSSVYRNLSFDLMDARELNFNKHPAYAKPARRAGGASVSGGQSLWRRLAGGFDVAFSNAALHWVDDHRKVLMGINKSLKTDGRLLLQMGGKGNAAAAFETIEEMSTEKKWSSCLKGFKPPYNFQSKESYKKLIPETGFKMMRIEMLIKDMTHDGKKGFHGFIRTTWLSFTERIPQSLRETFISEAAELFIKKYPMDQEGKVHIGMVRLEVEAKKV